MSLKAQYSPCVLLATKAHIFTYDFAKEEASEKYAFAVWIRADCLNGFTVI